MLGKTEIMPTAKASFVMQSNSYFHNAIKSEKKSRYHIVHTKKIRTSKVFLDNPGNPQDPELFE